jgi:hypothetical protein
MDVSKDQVIAELRREIAMRDAIYPKWIKSGKIAPSVAALRIAALKEACRDYERRYFGTQPGLDL